MNPARILRLPPDLPEELHSNIINYYFDISWWGLYAGATAAFLTIYATRIGATAAQIGLLSALPSAISLVLSLPFADVIRRMGAHRATWIGAFFSRIFFLPYALLPFFLTEKDQVAAILVIAVLMTVPNILVNIAFSQLLIEAVPPDWRGTVVGARNALFSIISFGVTMISGQILTHLVFPTNYQVVFAIGFIGAIATAYHLHRIRPLMAESSAVPAAAVSAAAVPATTVPATAAPPTARRIPRYLPGLNAQGRRYLRVIGLLFLINVTSNMVNPLVPGLLVNTIRLSDAWISIGTAANSLIVFIVSLFIARLTRRIGNRGGTGLGLAFLAVQAVALAGAVNPLHYLASVAVGGIGSGILITAQFNYHIENVPATDRAAWLSWNLLLGNAALLLGALSGPFLAGWIGVPLALVVFGGLRLVTGMVIYRWG